MSALYEFERQGRSIITVLVLCGIYAFLLLALVLLSMSLWIVWGIILFTLPALWDLAINPKSGLRIGHDDIEWNHGRRKATLPRAEIKRMHIAIRLDQSIKLSAELHNGRKIRLPQPATPPLKELEQALNDHGITFQKHPFALL